MNAQGESGRGTSHQPSLLVKKGPTTQVSQPTVAIVTYAALLRLVISVSSQQREIHMWKHK